MTIAWLLGRVNLQFFFLSSLPLSLQVGREFGDQIGHGVGSVPHLCHDHTLGLFIRLNAFVAGCGLYLLLMILDVSRVLM